MHVATEPLFFVSLVKNLSLFFVMSFEQSLKGGHPNSLGNTLEVVDAVLTNTDKMEDLFPVSYTHLTLPTICSV